MGYHVEILRNQGERKDPLRGEEVRALAASFPGARVESTSMKGGELDLVISRGDSRSYRFILQRGRLWTKNPEEDEIQVMIDIAAQLGARVRGDEFETFRTPTETFIHSDDQSEIQQAENSALQIRKTTRRKQWILNLTIMLIFAGLIGLTIYFERN